MENHQGIGCFMWTDTEFTTVDNISKIVDRLITKEKLFEKIDKTKVINTISEMLNEIPTKQMNFPEDELYEIIGGILALELVSGMLNELTPEQLKEFDEIVKRK